MATWTGNTPADTYDEGLHRDSADGRIALGDNTLLPLKLGTGADALTRITGDVHIDEGNGLVVGHTAQATEPFTGEAQILGTGQSDSSLILGRWNAGPTGPSLAFVKSRDPAIFDGTYAIVANNDVVGVIEWYPDDGVDLSTLAASFRAEVDDVGAGAGAIGMAFVWEQMTETGGALRETMRLAANGTLSFGPVDFTGRMRGANGSTSTPTYSFTSGTNEGMYLIADNQLGFSVNNNLSVEFQSAKAHVGGVVGNVDTNLEVSNDAAQGGGTIHAANYNAHSEANRKSNIRYLPASENVIALAEMRALRAANYETKREVWSKDNTAAHRRLIRREDNPDAPTELSFIYEDVPESIRGPEGGVISWNRTVTRLVMAFQELASNGDARQALIDQLLTTVQELTAKVEALELAA